MENSKIELKSKLLAKLFPKFENKTFWFLLLLIALLSILLGTIFTISLEIEHITRLWAKILLISLIIIFSILLVSTSIVIRINNSIEKVKAPDKIMENLFELAISSRTLKILIPIVTALIVFFGWDSYRNLKDDIIKKIDPKNQIKRMTELNEKTRALNDSTIQIHNYIQDYIHKLLPIGTIVAFNGKIDIPEGWAICDGREIQISQDNTFKTPNLVNRFILGTNEFSQIGVTGGSEEHSHTFEIKNDFNSLVNSPIPISQTQERIQGSLNYSQDRYPLKHFHALKFDYKGKTLINKNIPPYFSLIFIIKYK